MDWSGAPKITASVPPITAIMALDAMPSLEGLQVNVDVNAGAAPDGYTHLTEPLLELMA
jgi:hypothetical protein